MTSLDAAVAAARNVDVLALVQASPDAVVVLQHGRHVFANERALQLYGARDLAELASKPALDYMEPSLLPQATERMRAMTGGEQLDYVDEAIIRLDGTRCDIEVAGRPIVFDGGPAALVVIRDITDRKAADQARIAAEERFRAAFVHAPVGMAVVDTDGVLTEANAALARIADCPAGGLVGTSVFSWVHPDDRMAARNRFVRLLQGASTVETSEVRVVRRDGGLVWTQAATSALRDAQGRPTSFIVQLQDVTAHRSAEERLRDHASRDQLTGLANRAVFTSELQRTLDPQHPDAGGAAVLMLDLDRFKVINDSLGHARGDRLLTQVAARFRSTLRPTDLVARLGGDEFAVLLPGAASPEQAAAAARRLQECLAQPFVIDGADVHANVSIGIALAEAPADAEAVLRDADAAMHRAKAGGGGNFVTFDADLRADSVQRMELENGLYGALARAELHLVYQPIVEATSGALTGVEALLRWIRADGTLVPPDRFIPIAEETGLIVPIGAWVVREACQQLRVWRAAHPAAPPLSMAVNVSSRQLLDPELADEVLAAVDGIAPDQLTLEITETAAAEIGAASVDSLERLDRRGVRIAIDDFGTGQSSMSRLRELPVHLLKIDRRFTANLENSEGDRSIVRAMVAMADALGLVSVAEGVETEAQAALLRQTGCPLAQGFLFDRPRPPEELEPKLARRHLAVASTNRRNPADATYLHRRRPGMRTSS